MNEANRETENPYQSPAVDATAGITPIITGVDTSTEPTRFRWQVIPAILTVFPLLYSLAISVVYLYWTVGMVVESGSLHASPVIASVSSMCVSWSLMKSIHAWHKELTVPALKWLGAAVSSFGLFVLAVMALFNGWG